MAAPDPGPRRHEAAIAAALAGHGLIARGWRSLEEGEAEGRRSALLVGQAGASIWPHVLAWERARAAAPAAHPVDEWTRVVLEPLAARFGAQAVFPFERPFRPFQRWAKRAEGLRPSPLGLLMHPVYGLWHAYRGALLFAAEIPIQAPDAAIHPCDACIGKPCLSACPSRAWRDGGFDVRACMDHLNGPAGGACMSGGCLARNACPHGAAYRYPAAAQAHHQAFFRDGRRAPP